MDAPLMTPDELAQLLGIRRTGAYRLGREGGLRFAVVRIGPAGGRMRFLRARVEEWIRQGGNGGGVVATGGDAQ